VIGDDGGAVQVLDLRREPVVPVLPVEPASFGIVEMDEGAHCEQPEGSRAIEARSETRRCNRGDPFRNQRDAVTAGPIAAAEQDRAIGVVEHDVGIALGGDHAHAKACACLAQARQPRRSPIGGHTRIRGQRDLPRRRPPAQPAARSRDLGQRRSRLLVEQVRLGRGGDRRALTNSVTPRSASS
jgi:hypothetical protein